MEQIRLDLIPSGVMPIAHASQFDASRTKRFNLYNGGSVYTLSGAETIVCKARKPDGTEVDEAITNTSASYVDWTITPSILDDSGLAFCEMRITNGSVDVGSINFVLQIEEDAYNGANIEERTASGTIATFDTNLVEALTSCKCQINAIQSGSGTPSPSNPRAITGFSGANIVRCGFNQWDEEWELGAYNAQGEKSANANYIRSKNYIAVKPNTSFYAKTPNSLGRICFYDYDKTFISRSDTIGSSFTTPADCYYITFFLSGTTCNHDISINYPSTVTTYEPYNGTTYSITFGQTVYGGVLDVTNGKLTITHGEIDSYNGETINEPWISSIDEYVPNTNPSTGAQVVYELATPTEITLTEKEIEALLGTNNLYHDCNGQIEVKYLVEV